MKKAKFLVLLSMAFVVAASCMVTQAFAADATSVVQYGKQGGYLAIGDSITRGCCNESLSSATNNYDDNDNRNVLQSYPYLLSQSIGCTTPDDINDQSGTYWPLSYPGMSTTAFMDLIGKEDNFTEDVFDYYDELYAHFGSPTSLYSDSTLYGKTGSVGTVDELASKASLITVSLGMSDVFYRPMEKATNGAEFRDGFDLSNTDNIKEVVSTFTKEMYEGLNRWETEYPQVIQYLKEKNPNATIVMVGSYNLLSNIALTDEYEVPLGNIFNVVTNYMNKKYQQWATEYGVKFVDISNTEPCAAEQSWSIVGFLTDEYSSYIGVHPSTEGYKYIYRQILSSLDVQTTTPKKTDITIDLGRLTSVSSVYVNGKKFSNYTMNGSVLTVPYGLRTARVLTITSPGKNGATIAQVFKVTYNTKTGYTLKRVFLTNDMSASAKKIQTLVKTLTASISKAA